MRCRAIEAVLNEILGLHNKPKAVVHSVQYAEGPEEEEEGVCLIYEDCGSVVVKVLCYKSEGCWFDPSWCHWNFSLT